MRAVRIGILSSSLRGGSSAVFDNNVDLVAARHTENGRLADGYQIFAEVDAEHAAKLAGRATSLRRKGITLVTQDSHSAPLVAAGMQVVRLMFPPTVTTAAQARAELNTL